MSINSTTISTTGDGGENALFAKWQETKDEQVLAKLFKALKYHAESVCVLTLGRVDPDIVDEAVTKALYSAAKFRGDCLFSTWFHAIARNLCTSAIREKMRHREVELFDLGSGLFEDTLEEELALEQMMEGLDEDEMAIVQMKRDGYKDKEIAEALGVPRGSVHQKVTRVREKMLRNVCR